MNRHFLEFWGKAFLEAAKSQKHMEDWANLVQKGFWGFQDYNKLFKEAYGLDKAPENSQEYLNLWKNAEENFKESFRDYLNLLGMVPREEYEALVKENKELKEKLDDQDESLRQLHLLVDEKGMALEATSLEFQKLIKKQGEQFQKLFMGFSEAVQLEEDKT
jgi:BMFP domain-containing protein YqiC